MDKQEKDRPLNWGAEGDGEHESLIGLIKSIIEMIENDNSPYYSFRFRIQAKKKASRDLKIQGKW